MSKRYQNIVEALEELLENEHICGCDQSTCDINVCFNDGFTLWAIELFSHTGAASDEFSALCAKLPKRFKADAERERKAFVESTEYVECSCNAHIYHPDEQCSDDTVHCDSCGASVPYVQTEVTNGIN